eukprot:jgi/Tetstr1/454188/TSEL_041107.t1
MYHAAGASMLALTDGLDVTHMAIWGGAAGGTAPRLGDKIEFRPGAQDGETVVTLEMVERQAVRRANPAADRYIFQCDPVVRWPPRTLAAVVNVVPPPGGVGLPRLETPGPGTLAPMGDYDLNEDFFDFFPSPPKGDASPCAGVPG